MPIDACQMQSCSSSVGHCTDEPQCHSESGKADEILKSINCIQLHLMDFNGGIVG